MLADAQDADDGDRSFAGTVNFPALGTVRRFSGNYQRWGLRLRKRPAGAGCYTVARALPRGKARPGRGHLAGGVEGRARAAGPAGDRVVGRKNYYGAQTEWATHLAARVWTRTATAERNGYEPLAYLTGYLNPCAAAGGKPPEGMALERFFVWLPDPGDTAGSRDPDGPAP
ncbi:hypothetical protein [Frankia sp. Cj3]|uniref:hypothetical protein n=1 Tax=Frankia sp. Cj3 TaxID=2880976 RepID=UPI001EF511FD|nr:hypothetical protein [Frankia sp. Cj3]